MRRRLKWMNMDQFHELLLNRRSIRRYTDEPISADEVRLILEAGLMSPSSKRKMPWHFVVVEDKAMLEQLSQCRDAGAGPIANSALTIIVTIDMTQSEAWVEDGSIAAVLMQLQAHSLGLGSCWIQMRNRSLGEEATEDIVREMLDIPETMGILCAVTIGHKDEVRKPFDEEKMMWERVHISKW